jgi:hypothetical protein
LKPELHKRAVVRPGRKEILSMPKTFALKSRRIAAGRDLSKRLAKKIAALALFAVTFLPAAHAQVLGHGTYFVAGFFPDFAVVAIDSRELSGRLVDDHYCKIRPLSRDAFFFARGATSATNILTGASVFDARDIARDTYAKPGSSTTGLVERAADWANQIVHFYNTRPVEFGRSAVQTIMADGFFVGLDAHGDIGFARQTIRYRPTGSPKFTLAAEPRRALSTDPAREPTYVSGYFDIIREFKKGHETERAKNIVDRLGAFDGEPDAVAARYSAYVAAVRDWSGERGIGGEVATIILERGKGWRWFHRPPFCPAT